MSEGLVLHTPAGVLPVQQSLAVHCSPIIFHLFNRDSSCRGAFERVGQLQSAYPGQPSVVAYYDALAMLVDVIATSVLQIDETYFILKDMASKVRNPKP
jgi:hypothetical protein